MSAQKFQGVVHQLNVAPTGGVPKLPVESAQVEREGIVGDDQHDRQHHGGPDRALCLFSLEMIEELQREGHPIEPGAAGENLTIRGIPWGRVTPGARFVFESGVQAQVASYTSPCKTIAGSFLDGASKRIGQKLHPGNSRVYARIVKVGVIHVGERVELHTSA